MSHSIIIVLVLVAMVVAAPAAAQPGFGGKGKFVDRMFQRMDQNDDGHVTESEYHAAMQARFSRMDHNGDGALTKDELSQHMERARSMRKERWNDGEKTP